MFKGFVHVNGQPVPVEDELPRTQRFPRLAEAFAKAGERPLIREAATLEEYEALCSHLRLAQLVREQAGAT